MGVFNRKDKANLIAAKIAADGAGKGNAWYCDAAATSGNGKSRSNAFATITEALAIADDNDTIYIAPGDYDEGAALAITQDGLKMKGGGIDNHNSVLILSDTASHHLMTINANMVEIDGVGFTQTKDTYDAIRIASTVSSYKTWIHNCRFDGYGAGEYAIHTGTTYDSPDLVVENCVFRSWQTACIYANATRDIYRNNTFWVTSSKTGIQYVPTTGSRPDGKIVDNDFAGITNTTTTCIAMTGTPTAGNLMLGRNYVYGTPDVTIEAEANTSGTNNYYAQADGGALIDCNS